MELNIDGEVHVDLSTRNVRDLAAQYERYGSAQLVRMTDRGPLRVTVTSDQDHYRERGGVAFAGPGGIERAAYRELTDEEDSALD